MQTANAATTTQVQFIPLEKLHESPFNKRRTWGNLEELAESIGHVGVIEPLLARPVANGEGAKGLELVFGHRRYRASKIAKVPTAPVIVRDLTDDQAIEIQAIENLQRTDLHPLEEAEGYEQLRKIGWSPEDIASKVGKSRSYLFARLKLLELCQKAREAFCKGQITASVALYLARIPVEKLQLEALKEVLPHHKDDDPASARQAFRIIEQKYMLRLAEAPFDRGDVTLVPAAGSCSSCPKRTGNQKELFGDVASPDVCTDPLCFYAKREAHVAKERAALAAKGVKLVEGRRYYAHGEVYPPDTYAKLSEMHYDFNNKKVDKKTHAQLLKAAGVERERVVMIDEKGRTVDLVSKGQLSSVLKKLGGGKKAASSRSSSTSSGPKLTPEQNKAVEALEEEVLEEMQTKAISSPGSDATWRLVGYMAASYKRETWVKLSGKKLVAAVIEALAEDAFYDSLELQQGAKIFGIDLAKRTKAALDAIATKPSGKAPKKGGKK